MQPTFLIFTIALNGYQSIYKSYIKSHADYAKRIGATYVPVTRPYISKLGVECCWLKLYLMREALNAGYDYVLFVDADAEIKSEAPNILSNLKPGKHLYMANGYTGRFNSGVILARNDVQSVTFLTSVINSHKTTNALNDGVGWGENGYIIKLAGSYNGIVTLDQKWNNTYSFQLNDYIRHISYGPLRNGWLINQLHYVITRVSNLAHFAFSICNFNLNHQQLNAHLLNQEFRHILDLYPVFQNRN